MCVRACVAHFVLLRGLSETGGASECACEGGREMKRKRVGESGEEGEREREGGEDFSEVRVAASELENESRSDSPETNAATRPEY